jgi:hypothetical protein
VTTETGRSVAADGRLDDIRIARVHLRLGQLTIARAELEDLLRRDALDTNGLAALAEARWRTGDGDAAAQAAIAHLDAGGSDDVALCIAAEAAALDGRASDARDLMDRLPAADVATLDAIFAGLPRRAPWPTAPVERTDLGELRREASSRIDGGRPGPAINRAPDRTPVRDASEDAAQTGAAGPAAPRRPAPGATRRIKAQLDPLAELAQARAELETRPDRAFLRLALVLRHDPTLAPSVLDVLHLRREPTAALLRGDAQRLLGRHLEAEAAFDAAAESLEVS